MNRKESITAVVFALTIILALILIVALRNPSSKPEHEPGPDNGSTTPTTSAPQDEPVRILFCTDKGEGIRVYSELTSDVRTIIRSDEDLEGLTYDWVHRKVYYANDSRIYAAHEDGTGVKTVSDFTWYGGIQGLAFDWITNNLYGVGTYGYVFVCNSSTSELLSCTSLLAGQDSPHGIAVDPNNGEMYWTHYTGSIMRAQMDGSNSVQVVTRLRYPAGIAIDYSSSRMFWTEFLGDKISSSKLDGTDIQTIVTLPSSTSPWGIALHNDKIYWANWNSKSLQRSSKSGQDVHTLLTGTRPIHQLTTTRRNFPTTRRNHCEGQNCPKICVLTSFAFRCAP